MSLERDEQDNEPPLLALHLRRLPRSYDHVHVAPRRPGTLHRPRRTPHRCSNHILLPCPRRRETRSAGRVCRRSRETDRILRETAYEYENIFFKNPLFTSRAKGVGILSSERAIALGSTGPALRGSGVDRDLRKDEPYAAYGELDFRVHT